MNATIEYKIKKITRADAQHAYCCMTEVPTPWPKALCQCRDWIKDNLGVYVEGYHLLDQEEDVIGHIYYADSANALISYQVESGVAVLYCEWVQQRYQKQGLGKHLFDSFLRDRKEENAKGILVEATDIPGQMHYSHYLNRGFKMIDDNEHQKLMFLPIIDDTVAAHRRKPLVKPRRGIPVEILILRGFLCPYEVSTQILVREVAREFGDKVRLEEVQLTPKTLKKYGLACGILLNGKQKLFGGEPERAVRQAILDEF